MASAGAGSISPFRWRRRNHPAPPAQGGIGTVAPRPGTGMVGAIAPEPSLAGGRYGPSNRDHTGRRSRLAGLLRLGAVGGRIILEVDFNSVASGTVVDTVYSEWGVTFDAVAPQAIGPIQRWRTMG